MKGQVSVFYLGILTVISLAIFGIILVWNLSIKDANTDLLAELEINSIIEKIETDIYYIESLNTSGKIEITRNIPTRLGEDFYTITLRADGTSNNKGGYSDNDQIIITKDAKQRFTLSKTIFSKDIDTNLFIIPSSLSGGKYTLTSNTSGIKIN
jgi:hypothetical protein